jgi:hypothetical protein
MPAAGGCAVLRAKQVTGQRVVLRWLGATLSAVVLANAGTHGLRPFGFRTRLDTGRFPHHNPRRVWVPAFAGTTTPSYEPVHA